MEKLNVIEFMNNATTEIHKNLVENCISVDNLTPLVEMAVDAELVSYYLHGVYSDVKTAIESIAKGIEKCQCNSAQTPFGQGYEKWVRDHMSRRGSSIGLASLIDELLGDIEKDRHKKGNRNDKVS